MARARTTGNMMLRGVGVGVCLYVAVQDVVSVPVPRRVFRPRYRRSGGGAESAAGFSALARRPSTAFRACISRRERRA